MDVNVPEIVAEVEAAFARYETALVTNDVATLDALFHDAPETIRYGAGENLYGDDAIRNFRAGRNSSGLERTLERTVIATCLAVGEIGTDLDAADHVRNRRYRHGTSMIRLFRDVRMWFWMQNAVRVCCLDGVAGQAPGLPSSCFSQGGVS